MNPLALQEDAGAAIESRDRRRSLSTSKLEELGAHILSDSYLFARRICKHTDLLPSVHMPLSYLACGLTDRLIETFDIPECQGYVTRKITDELFRRQIDWRTPAGRTALDELINGTRYRPAILNIRLFRRIFKSSTITHAATLFIATVDPNETIKITHAVDPKAWEFCEQIGKTVLSGTYHDFFPNRVPQGDLSKLVSQKRITIGGRTISHPQTTIQASGYGTKEEAAHYSTFITDDLVTDLNSSPDLLRGVRLWQQRLTGYYMPTRRIRRLEVGTKHDEDDDDGWLTDPSRGDAVFSLRVPIMEYDHPVMNLTEMGKPTVPELFPVERILIEQAQVLSGQSGDEDEDGWRTWANQYLLSATGGSLRLFPPEIVMDHDRWWIGPFEHANSEWKRRGHFLIGRIRRDREGRPIGKNGVNLYDRDGKLIQDWQRRAAIVTYDPWRDLDRAILVDPAWTEREHSDNWAVSCVGQDVEDIRFQLQTISDKTGYEGWISALDYLNERWQPRVIGYDAAALQDEFVQNLMRTDKRLRRLQSKMVKIKHNQKSKPARMQDGLSYPLFAYRFFLAPPYKGTDEFGGNITRMELKAIKSTPQKIVKSDEDGIADSLAMSGVVLRPARRDVPPERRRVRIDPILGVPVEDVPRGFAAR